MRKTTRTLLTLGLTAMMAVSSFMTAFAASLPEECPVTIFGQRPVQDGNGMTDNNGEVWHRSYVAILPGVTEVQLGKDVILNDGCKYYGDANKVINLTDYSLREDDGWLHLYLGADEELTVDVWIWNVPADTPIESLGEDAKFVINPNSSNTTEADTGAWASNETGWWIQFKDGSYLTSAWWQSPDSGLWYYMGADGYMVTNTVVDNRTINADGVWVQ